MSVRTRLIAALSAALPFTASAQSQLNLTQGVTEISNRVYDLHMTILYICIVIGIVVFGAMFWSMIAHRKSRGHKPATFHENIKVEILWTVIPFVILIGMAIPATSTLIAMEDTSESDVTVLVTGSQWKWHYRYFEHDVEYFSLLATRPDQIKNKLPKGDNYLLEVDRPLVIPTGKKVRFLITSDDVIHSWWVPAFAVKKDANPGFINEAWTKVDEPGIYRGQCAELCGKDHGYMPIVVIAKEPAEYEAWITAQETTQREAKEEEQRLLALSMTEAELMQLGERVYLGNCAACHQPNGQGIPGVFPSLVGTEMVTNDINGHIDIVLYGKQGTSMQAFGNMLTLREIAAVVTYERNAWGNNTGELIQAADVNARMKN
jgi:cytochrome c oxidase subunit II